MESRIIDKSHLSLETTGEQTSRRYSQSKNDISKKYRGDKVLALVLAGGAGGRLDVITEQRAKPVVPFGGTLRLIDFPLSNCCHSRLPNVWLIEQYEVHKLNEHLANGRPWDMDRTYGGLQVLPPFEIYDPNKRTDDNDDQSISKNEGKGYF
ncbi:unnamed protein product [Rotaria sp. Silwood2]|nr:unnamed protein product [Rotaria sp. Silwood2]CAF4447230.1 unnamed protein product [Rotaria sp. Silwood2]